MDVEFDGGFGFADTHVAIGAGGVQDTRDKELLPEVGTLVQEDLAGEQQQRRSKRPVRRRSIITEVIGRNDLSLTLKGGRTHTKHQHRVRTGSAGVGTVPPRRTVDLEMFRDRGNIGCVAL